MNTKGKAAMYLTNTSDQRRFKNLKPKTIQPSVEPESHMFGSTKNIMKNLLAASSYLSPYPEDQILQLTQRTLNLIGQAVNLAIAKSLKGAVNKTLDQRLRQDCRQPAMEF